MLFIEVDNHFDYVIKQWESKLVIKNTDSSWVLSLLDSECLEFRQSECISPPVGFIGSSILSFLMSSSKLWFVFNIGDSGQERIMHNQWKLLFGVNDVKLDKIGSLIECSFESFKCVFRKNRSKTSVSNV